jgi:hypothetical protein
MTLTEMTAMFRLMAGPQFEQDKVKDATVHDWLNEGHRYISNAFRVYETISTVTFTESTASVSTPARFVSVHDGYGNAGGLIDSSNQGLIEIAPLEARHKVTTGLTTEHVWFWVWDNKIYVLPVIAAEKVYSFLHFAEDTKLSDTHETPSYSEVYHEHLVTYALYKAYLSKVYEGQRDRRALNHWNIFKEQVSLVKSRQRKLGQPRPVPNPNPSE